MKTDTQYRSNCPINQTIELLGDNWSLLIVRDILFFNKTNYGDFLESPEGISTNILASRLKLLESKGIIEKLIDQKDRKKSFYLLTDKGIELAPMLVEMIVWGHDWADTRCERPERLIDIVTRLKKDRTATLKPFLEKYRSFKADLLA